MIKKLQCKFIFITMLLVGFVLIGGLSFIYYMTYTTSYDSIKSSLSQSISYAQGAAFPTPLVSDQPTFTQPEVLLTNSPTVTLSIDETTGQIIHRQEHLMSMADSTIEIALATALEQKESMGQLPEMHLYYERVHTKGITYIAFANTTSAENLLHQTLLNLIIWGLFAMVLFFLVSVLLATLAIRPVKKAWKQQQQFVGDASHELKTPLTVIIANSNILLSKKRQSPEDQKKWVKNTLSEAQHMKALVDHLLLLANSDSTSDFYPLTRLNFSEVILNCILQFEPVAFERRLTMTYEIPKDLYINGNEIGLKQVIDIFLDNACKYAGERGHIHIRLFSLGPYLRLAVNNTGSVIPKEDLPHIFERFYRSDKVRTRQDHEKGYGLGLSIARSIVHRHRGQCLVTSDERNGTTFIAQFKK